MLSLRQQGIDSTGQADCAPLVTAAFTAGETLAFPDGSYGLPNGLLIPAGRLLFTSATDVEPVNAASSCLDAVADLHLDQGGMSDCAATLHALPSTSVPWVHFPPGIYSFTASLQLPPCLLHMSGGGYWMPGAPAV